MPIYTYRTIKADGSEGDIFEVEQPVGSPSLKVHPQTGEKIERIYDVPNLTSQYTPGKEKSLSDLARVKRAGFEVFEKDKISGKYFRK